MVKIFLKGISIHEEAPFKTGRVTSKEEAQILLQWATDLGSNFVHLHTILIMNTWLEKQKMGLLIWSNNCGPYYLRMQTPTQIQNSN